MDLLVLRLLYLAHSFKASYDTIPHSAPLSSRQFSGLKVCVHF